MQKISIHQHYDAIYKGYCSVCQLNLDGEGFVHCDNTDNCEYYEAYEEYLDGLGDYLYHCKRDNDLDD